MAYADYQYYVNEYYGSKLTEAEFPKYAKRATAEMNHVTFGRLERLADSQITDMIKDCMCDIAEKMQYFETTTGAEVASENNDGYSVTYRTVGDVDSRHHEIFATIRTYLAPTGLMYRGNHKHSDDYQTLSDD